MLGRMETHKTRIRPLPQCTHPCSRPRQSPGSQQLLAGMEQDASTRTWVRRTILVDPT